ncbi:hypothetical protein [Propionivibrio sp.]|uniref:hypothetical protein n=1 Tax=Propionivibrio sp. TaxID=2212460 RepID=UPI003BF44DBC
MALPESQWVIIRTYYERGFKLAEIIARDDVDIKSAGSISKRAKAEGWIFGGKKKEIIEEVKAKQFLSDLIKEKEKMHPLERNVHDTIVSERLKTTVYFKGVNMLVAEITERKLRSDDETASYQDLNAAATAITKAQENILGKQPDTVINNTNAMQSNAGVIEVTPDQIRHINKLFNDAC